jgi:carbamoyltransferase
MYILGLSFTSHDAAASLIKDGEIVVACEEERFNRQKHTKDFPAQAISFCLSYAGITIDDVGQGYDLPGIQSVYCCWIL